MIYLVAKNHRADLSSRVFSVRSICTTTPSCTIARTDP
jgi:hypothetical protein